MHSFFVFFLRAVFGRNISTPVSIVRRVCVALWMHVGRNSLPTATGVATATLGYMNMLPAELLVVLPTAALQQWR